MKIGGTFSGYGGLDMAVTATLGGEVAWHCEIEPAPSKILAHHWPDVPNLGDITAVDWSAVEPVDVLTGGFPCQDVSHAGKRLGLRPDTRSGLWSQMAYAIDKLRPRLVVAENVRGLLSARADGDLEPCPWCVGDEPDGALRALGAVLGDLAELGYDARWAGVRASDVGAPHGRFRVFVVAWDASGERVEGHRPRGVAEPRAHAGAGLPVSPGDLAAAHADRLGHERGRRARDGRPGPADGSVVAPDAPRDGRHEGRPEPAGIVGGPDAAECSAASPDAYRDGFAGLGRIDTIGRDADGRGGADIAWGPYEPAIRRWERVLGRPAPSPTEPGQRGKARLSPRFVEWMMGLPAGHVTDVPGISRNDQLKALGNGVVPQQAALALRSLLDPMEVAA